MLFDSHCHLDFPAFDGDREAVVARARAVGVTGFLVPGVGPAQWARGARVAKAIDGARFAVGLHPQWLSALDDDALLLALRSLPEAAVELGAAAIGECGLDRRVDRGGGPSLAQQATTLRAHAVVARELALPLVLHVVGAHGPALELLRPLGPFAAGGVVHGYSGPAELVADYCRLGLCLAFGGAVTHPRAKKARAAALEVSAERLLLETDAPDQPLSEGRPRSEPSELPSIAAVVAGLRGEDAAALGARTADNARRLFAAS